MASTDITGEHKRVVEALEIGECRNFAPVSRFVGGGPAVAIAAVLPTPPEAPDDRPLFVPVAPAMRPTDHDGAGA